MFKTNEGIPIHADVNVSVSHGTLRNQDLITTFTEVLKDTPEYEDIMHMIPQSAWSDENHDWWESYEASILLDDIFNILNNYAPPGTVFTNHEGDGSDFAFWSGAEFDVGEFYKSMEGRMFI